MIRRKYRYAFRLNEDQEKMMEFLRLRYRFWGNTYIIEQALKKLYQEELQAAERMKQTTPDCFNRIKPPEEEKKPSTKKGRTK